MSCSKQAYAGYWKEETNRLKFNLDYLRNQIRSNKEYLDVYWLRCNLSQSGALDPNPLVDLDGHCCLIRDYLMSFTKFIENPEFRVILWQYGHEAALSWITKLIGSLIKSHFRPGANHVDEPIDHSNNNNNNNATTESYLRVLALVVILKMLEPIETKAGSITRKELTSKLEIALENLISSKRWRNKGITISDIKGYLELKTNQITSDNIGQNATHVELECQHSFDSHTDKCLRTAIWQEVERMTNILVPSYPCDMFCKERMRNSRPFFNINCRPSRLAYAISSCKVANVILQHPFNSDEQWFEHDKKLVASWPCRCLDLLHNEEFIRTWIRFFQEAFGKQNECNGMSMISQLVNHYSTTDSEFRRELTGWVHDYLGEL